MSPVLSVGDVSGLYLSVTPSPHSPFWVKCFPWIDLNRDHLLQLVDNKRVIS